MLMPLMQEERIRSLSSRYRQKNKLYLLFFYAWLINLVEAIQVLNGQGGQRELLEILDLRT